MEYTGQNTIYDYLSNIDIPDGIHSMTLANGEVIDFEIYNYYENTTFSETPVLGDNVPDTKMLILKFHKNLTIKESIKIIPQVRKKGMTIYCAGILENNGTISMTARGAIAQGQDVLLYRNNDGTYEFVPKVGAAGGNSAVSISEQSTNGIKGDDGTNRQLGGGGSGAARSWRRTGSGQTCSGMGASATSYSGGSGGGGIHLALNANSNNYYAGHGGANGGSGGAGWAQQDNTAPTLYAGGGAGNNGGTGEYSISRSARVKYSSIYGQNGTGGLLVIFVEKLINNGYIESNGCNGGACSISSAVEANGGGASGGGSINIFYKHYDNQTGTILVNGGEGGYFGGGSGARAKGGNGGTGCITLTLVAKTYHLIKDEGNYKYYFDDNWIILNHVPSKDDFIKYGIPSLSKIPSELWNNLSKEVEIIFATDIKENWNIYFNAIPNSQMILQTSYIDLYSVKNIKSLVANDTLSENGSIRRILSIDMGQTWLYFDSKWKEFKFVNPLPIEKYPNLLWDEWINEEHTQDIENIKQIGLTQEQLFANEITEQQWSKIFPSDNPKKRILFITVISIEEYTDIAEAINIQTNQETYEKYISNTNFIQTQTIDKIIVVPQFNSKQIKINYIV